MSKDILPKLSAAIERACAYISCSLLALNICDILMGVVSRYLFHTSFIWTEELARYTLIWMVMVGASCAHVRGDMMAIDFILPRLPVKLQRTFNVLKFIIGVIVLMLIVYFGAHNAIGAWNMRTMGLKIPKTIPLLSLPVGLGILLVEFVIYRKEVVGGDEP